ncbi:MAG TPA: VCBS repeat-containing protein [Nannocystaceae bacterium]|nr:VCBS repeat-containing protein [Nannocystaceae bacterium]
MRWVGIALLVSACGPTVAGGSGESGGSGTGRTSATTSGTTSPPPYDAGDVAIDLGTRDPDSSTSSSSTGDDDGGGCFVGPLPDVGDQLENCVQPEPTEQAASCGDGVLTPGELCYRGAVSRCWSDGGYTGMLLADFGHGPAVGYVRESGHELWLLPATIGGMLGGPCVVDLGDGGLDYVHGIGAIELDDDGDDDLVVSLSDNRNAVLAAYRNDGAAEFALAAISDAPRLAFARPAETNGVPPLDVIALAEYSTELWFLALASDGAATLVKSVTMRGDYLDIVMHSIADVDGDGLADVALLAYEWKANESEILLVLGASADGTAPTSILVGAGPTVGTPTLGRFDDDATVDLVYALDDELVFRAGLGDGTFGPEVMTGFLIDTFGVDAIDLDGDGRAELIGHGELVSFAADGMPLEHVSFDPGQLNYAMRQVEAAELNGDGLLDLVFLTDGGQKYPSLHLVLSNP